MHLDRKIKATGTEMITNHFKTSTNLSSLLEDNLLSVGISQSSFRAGSNANAQLYQGPRVLQMTIANIG